MAELIPDRSEGDRSAPLAAGGASRTGLVLFALYLAFYVGFVGLNAFFPALMQATPGAGVNVATVYGMALIVGAFALALLYAWLLRGSNR